MTMKEKFVLEAREESNKQTERDIIPNSFFLPYTTLSLFEISIYFI
jgi:hypothetical protein